MIEKYLDIFGSLLVYGISFIDPKSHSSEDCLIYGRVKGEEEGTNDSGVGIFSLWALSRQVIETEYSLKTSHNCSAWFQKTRCG
jgi:hypothetical protein